MFTKDDEKYLTRQLGSNQVVLFLGSGFSFDAKNQLGENFPTGKQLGAKIWEFLKYPPPYDGTPLPQMYQAFLNAGIKADKKAHFLHNNLLSEEISPAYNAITYPYWYKIYTVNVDDVLTSVYKRNAKHIEELIFPHDEFSERDQSLITLQINYLHGKIPCKPDEIIFSTQQYAKSHLVHQPLYGQFVYDYASLPTIFIGTEMDEPIFERYIEAREERNGFREFRPKSFLISPALSPVKVDNLKNNYNVHFVEGTTSNFLNWILKIKDNLPERKAILRTTFPNLLDAANYADISGIPVNTVLEFSKSFNRVPKEYKLNSDRSAFLSGASPRWNDIFRGLDIQRTMTSKLFDAIKTGIDNIKINEKTTVFNLTGYAGSGKSTILKRLGIMLSQSGHTIFLSYSDLIPNVRGLTDVLNAINGPVVLLFDNATNIKGRLKNIIEEFNQHLKYPPIIVLSIRTNFIHLVSQYLSSEIAQIFSYPIPDLDNDEIQNLIGKLDEHNLLGVLKGKSEQYRIDEFKHRAKRQILIAMKEATAGRSFDEIIKDEFKSLNPTEAQVICVCIALNTQLGYTNSVQDVIGFSNVSPNETMSYLKGVLEGTILWVGNSHRFMLRHRVLADYIVKDCSSPEMLKEAYIRVLSVLAPELKKNHGPSKKFNLFKSLVDHKVLYSRFSSNINHAREVYDSITEYFSDQAQFWLQYGSLETEGDGGDLTLAEHYITQAESLAPHSNYIQSAKCNLFYKKAVATDSVKDAHISKGKADELTQSLLLSRGKEDAYIQHIYCRGRYEFTTKWVSGNEQKKHALKKILEDLDIALAFHPENTKLIRVSETIKRAYLQLGLNVKLEAPELPT